MKGTLKSEQILLFTRHKSFNNEFDLYSYKNIQTFTESYRPVPVRLAQNGFCLLDLNLWLFPVRLAALCQRRGPAGQAILSGLLCQQGHGVRGGSGTESTDKDHATQVVLQ